MGKLESERETALRSATAELRSCIALIEASSRPADREQLEGASEALALLIPLEFQEVAPATVPIPQQEPTPEPFRPPPIFASPEPARPVLTPVRSSPTPPALDRPKRTGAVIAGLLMRLTSLYSRRRSLLDDPLAAWRHLQTVDRQVEDAMSSISWIKGDAVGFVEARFGTEDDPDDHFASSLVMLRSGDAEPVFRFLTRGGPSPEHAAGVLMALRMCPGESSMAKLKTLFVATRGKMRRGILSVLADCGELSTDWLLNALDEPDDTVATRAAEVVAWFGRSPEDAQAVETRALRDAPVDRRQALLFAAVALGSERALAEIQGLLDSGATVASWAIDALAVGGGPNDVPRLLALAARQPELAALAVLAAGHLGDPNCASAISSSALSGEVKDRALRAILGDRPPTPAPQSVGRRLYGEPWTVSGALARLIAPDELLQTRTWRALEIGVRLGVRPQVFFDPEASSDRQTAAMERIRVASAITRRSKGSGKWLFFGHPIR